MDLPDDLQVSGDYSGVVVTIGSLPGRELRVTRGRFDSANTEEEKKRLLENEIAAWLIEIDWRPPAPPRTAKKGSDG